LEWANHVIELFGMARFLADVDSGREFWRDDDGCAPDDAEPAARSSTRWSEDDFGLAGAVLSWVATEGWAQFAEFYDVDYHTASAFRARHSTQAILALIKAIV